MLTIKSILDSLSIDLLGSLCFQSNLNRILFSRSIKDEEEEGEEEEEEEDERLSGDEAMDFLSADFGMEEGEESDEEEGMSSKAMKHMALQHSEEVCTLCGLSVGILCCTVTILLPSSSTAATFTILSCCRYHFH
jgi:hypothetical protein